MKKLSAAQQNIVDRAKAEIDLARTLGYAEWVIETHKSFQKRYVEEAIETESMKKYWEDNRNGIVLTHCNSKSLEKLQTLGLIEIIYDSKGEKGYGIDKIKVINY
jgi:hypothetical protein